MKKSISISGVITFVTGAMFAILLICAFSSCTASRHWYAPRSHNGCQSSQGMGGY